MIVWIIAMGDREAPLDSVEIPAVRTVTDPIMDHLAARLAPIADEGDLTIVFHVGDDRGLSVRLRGEPFIVNRARDTLGQDERIGPLLS